MTFRMKFAASRSVMLGLNLCLWGKGHVRAAALHAWMWPGLLWGRGSQLASRVWAPCPQLPTVGLAAGVGWAQGLAWMCPKKQGVTSTSPPWPQKPEHLTREPIQSGRPRGAPGLGDGLCLRGPPPRCLPRTYLRSLIVWPRKQGRPVSSMRVTRETTASM